MNTEELLEDLPKRAEARRKEFQAVIKRLRKRRSGEIEQLLERLHHEVFDEIDCLACGNCCRTLGPKIIERDVTRLGKALRMSFSAVYDTYMRGDEDGDWVFKTMPCPFLGDDNRCFVYESRPKACADYPHTEGRQVRSHLGQLLKNSRVCPAVFLVLDRLCVEI